MNWSHESSSLEFSTSAFVFQLKDALNECHGGTVTDLKVHKVSPPLDAHMPSVRRPRCDLRDPMPHLHVQGIFSPETELTQDMITLQEAGETDRHSSFCSRSFQTGYKLETRCAFCRVCWNRERGSPQRCGCQHRREKHRRKGHFIRFNRGYPGDCPRPLWGIISPVSI